MQKNVNIIGCGYIGKKVARQLLIKNIIPYGFVKNEISKQVCDQMGVVTTLFDLDCENTGLGKTQNYFFERSAIAYFSAPPAKGEVDTRMLNFIAYLKNLAVAPLKIVLISTTGVYGDCKGQWIDESHVVKPQAARAHRRLSAETQLKKYCDSESVELIVFRVPGIYAEDKLPLKRILSGEPIVKAEYSGFTNRVHADDLSAFCVEALLENVASGTYNCCDGKPSTMHDYFTKVADAMNYSRPPEISLQQAKKELSAGMLSYLAESKRISNKKLLMNFKTQFQYPDLDAGLLPLK